MADAPSDGSRPAPAAGTTPGGTHTLLVDLVEPTRVRFGAAGDRALRPGCYACTGSALGPGGLARVDRRRRAAAGDHDLRHWHVDYLLGHPDARLFVDARSPGLDADCAVAGASGHDGGTEPVPRVGASD